MPTPSRVLPIHDNPRLQFFNGSWNIRCKMWKLLLFLHLMVGCLGNDQDNTLEGETLKEVESLLAKDPNLPRLTRGEILSLIKEIREGKEVVIVMPQQTDDIITSTASPPSSSSKRPLKRRRKPIRPVYRHKTTTSTTKKSIEESSESVTEVPEDTVRPLYITPEWLTSTAKPTTRRITSTPKTAPTTTSTAAPDSVDIQQNPDMSLAAESLGDDMKQLLNSFGLLGPTSTTERISFQGPITPTVDPTSYSRFKPLPMKVEGMSSEMKSFLSSFGLLDQRRQKAIQSDVMDNTLNKGEEDYKVKKSEHVFNPVAANQNNTIELLKINRILEKLRQISEGNKTALDKDEIQELLILENNTRLASQEDIDPALDLYQELENKNEIKRQQPNITSTTTTTSPTTESSVAEETTVQSSNSDTSTAETESSESPREPSVDELEASFGGDGDTTTARPNGFYFLLDWNSFLDVGVPDGKQININFSPKVGDPRQFINVQI